MQSDKPSNSQWIYLDHLYVIERGGVLEQNPVQHLFELLEYLRYDHRLKRIVSCFFRYDAKHSFAILLTP